MKSVSDEVAASRARRYATVLKQTQLSGERGLSLWQKRPACTAIATRFMGKRVCKHCGISNMHLLRFVVVSKEA